MEYTVDIALMHDNMQEYLKEVFGFNDSYGMNLDAFNDRISEMRDVRINVINCQMADDKDRKMINILISNAVDNDDIRLVIQL